MQALPRNQFTVFSFRGIFLLTVKWVAEKRMTYALHMNPYLMRPTGFKLTFYIAKSRGKIFNGRYVRDGFPAAGNYRHLFSVGRVSPYRLVDGARLFDFSESDGMINS